MARTQHMAARPWRLVRWLDLAIPFVLGVVITVLLMLGAPLVTAKPTPAPTTVPVVQPDWSCVV